jgi:hypothetical protein
MSTSTARFFINVEFDNKDAIRAKFPIHWDNTHRSWYADDAENAAAAQSLARESSGSRHFAEQENAAAQRKAATAADAVKSARVASALKHTSLALAQIVDAESILHRRAKQKFPHADDEHTFREIFSDLAQALNLQSNTRNRGFDANAALAALAALAAAKRVLAV